MPLLEWKSAYAQGINMLDDGHRRLFARANDLYDWSIGDEPVGSIAAVARDVASFAQADIAREECFFEVFGYPDAETHRQDHRRLLAELAAFGRAFPGGNERKCAAELALLLADWFAEHAMTFDRAFGRYLAGMKVCGFIFAAPSRTAIRRIPPDTGPKNGCRWQTRIYGRFP